MGPMVSRFRVGMEKRPFYSDISFCDPTTGFGRGSKSHSLRFFVICMKNLEKQFKERRALSIE